MRLQLGERGSRITAKAPPLRALLAVGLKVLAQRLPGTDRFGDAGCARDRVEAGGRASEASHRATQPQCGGSALASGGAPLMRAMGAKPLLSLMMGTRQLGDALAVQEPWPVTLGDCTEVLEAGARVPAVAWWRGIAPSSPPRRCLTAVLSRCSSLPRIGAACSTPRDPTRTSGHQAAVAAKPRSSRAFKRRRAWGKAPLLRPARGAWSPR